jgi:hypothetical protein
LSRPIRIAQLDNQIAVDTESVAALQKRVDAANQDITAIRSQMSSEFKPLLEFQNVSNQVFALELTIDGLDKCLGPLKLSHSFCKILLFWRMIMARKRCGEDDILRLIRKVEVHCNSG